MDTNKLKELHQQGLSNRAMAKELDCHHRTIADWLKKLELEPLNKRQPIERVSDTEARCRTCSVIYPLTNFQYNRKGQKYEYQLSSCNGCTKKRAYLSLNRSPEAFIGDRYNRLVLRAAKTGIICTITRQELLDLWSLQRGLCFYTDIPLVTAVGQGKNPNSMSIDKVVPEVGYVSGNVVLCSNRINTVKHDLSLAEIQEWMPGWHERIVRFLK